MKGSTFLLIRAFQVACSECSDPPQIFTCPCTLPARMIKQVWDEKIFFPAKISKINIIYALGEAMLEKVEIFWQLLTIFDNVDTILTDSWHHVVNMLPMLTFHSTIMLRQSDSITRLLCSNRKTWPKDRLTKWVYEMLARLKTNTVLVSFQNAGMLPCFSNGLVEQSCLKPACSKTKLNDWPA